MKLAGSLSTIARARGIRLLIANDPQLADRLGAAGVHFSEANVRQAHIWRSRRPRWLITTAAHSLAACTSAGRFGADAVYLSPIFPTESHLGRGALGAVRARLIVARVGVPVYALGGLNEQTARLLARSRFAGIAAVGALAA